MSPDVFVPKCACGTRMVKDRAGRFFCPVCEDLERDCADPGRPLTLDEYQGRAFETAIYPGKGACLSYPVMGLAGEVGEVCNQVKKIHRDDNGMVCDARREAIAAELGDVLWYCAALATELHINLSKIAQDNLAKLANRQAKGSLGGSGDKR